MPRSRSIPTPSAATTTTSATATAVVAATANHRQWDGGDDDLYDVGSAQKDSAGPHRRRRRQKDSFHECVSAFYLYICHHSSPFYLLFTHFIHRYIVSIFISMCTLLGGGEAFNRRAFHHHHHMYLETNCNSK